METAGQHRRSWSLWMYDFPLIRVSFDNNNVASVKCLNHFRSPQGLPASSPTLALSLARVLPNLMQCFCGQWAWGHYHRKKSLTF